MTDRVCYLVLEHLWKPNQANHHCLSCFLPNRALAMVAYEDTYLTVLDVDGTDWADKLRVRMHDQSTDLATEQSWLLGSNTIV